MGIAGTGSISSSSSLSEPPDTASRISLVASSNFPSSGSFYRLLTRSSYVIITSLLAGEYGIITVTSIGISRPREGGNNSRMMEEGWNSGNIGWNSGFATRESFPRYLWKIANFFNKEEIHLTLKLTLFSVCKFYTFISKSLK